MIGTWIVGAVVFIIIGLAAYKIYNDRKTGKGCSGGCGNCQSCTEHGNKNL